MKANPILMQKNMLVSLSAFARRQNISYDAALDFFYHSAFIR